MVYSSVTLNSFALVRVYFMTKGPPSKSDALVTKSYIRELNSSLMMSLGAGALEVSGGSNAISREEVSMETLEAGTTPRAAYNRHRHTE